MKTIGTEEHFVTDEILAAWSRLAPSRARGLAGRRAPGGGQGAAPRGR